MEVVIQSVAVDAEVICEHCGTGHNVYVDDGDTYFSEDQMVNAIVDRLDWEGWDKDLCPDCVFERDNPDEEE